MKNTYVKSFTVLTLICAVITAVLAAVNFFSAPVIAENEEKAAKEACFTVMEGAVDFEELDLSQYSLPATVTAVYRESTGMGYVFKLSTRGYADGLVIVCGIDTDGLITGIYTVATSETEDLGGQAASPDSEYILQYIGKDSSLSGINDLFTSSETEKGGATKTSDGYKNAIRDAFTAFAAVAKGES